MAEVGGSVTVTVRDLASVKLLVVSLTLLHDRMRVEANQRAAELGNILERFEQTMSDGGEGDGDESETPGMVSELVDELRADPEVSALVEGRIFDGADDPGERP